MTEHARPHTKTAVWPTRVNAMARAVAGAATLFCGCRERLVLVHWGVRHVKDRRVARLALFAMTSLLWISSESGAQSIGELERTFAPFETELLKAAPSSPFRDFWDGLAVLRQEDTRQRSMEGSIDLGFHGDQAGPDSLFTIDTGASLSRGTYPAELRFDTKLHIQVRDSEFQQDATRFRLNYDYHDTKYSEYYTFIERFSDNFMGIQQRYETGVGARYGAYLLQTENRRSDEVEPKLVALEGSSRQVRERLDSLTKDALKDRVKPGGLDYDALQRTVESMRNTLRAEQAKLFLGVAFSASSELEQAKIEALVMAPSAAATTQPAKQTFSLPAQHRYRLTIRPTVMARPTQRLKITVYPYFKLPLENPRYVTVEGKDLVDYRVDLDATIKWDLPANMTSNEKVALVFEVEDHFDNVPPRIRQEKIDAAAEAGTILTHTVAQRRHSAVSLSVSITWGRPN